MSLAEAIFLTAADGSEAARLLPQLAECLRGAGYEASAIGALIQADSIYGLDVTMFPFYRWHARSGNALSCAARLFLLEEPVPRESAEALLGPLLLAGLLEIGMLCVSPDGGIRAVANVYPLDGFLFASDPMFFWDGLPGGRPRGSEVYYIGGDSFDLARATPRSDIGRVLDLCTGSGVQALLAARHAAEVVGIDINGRAVRFARVNARLNGVENASFLEGDLFEPVAGRTFDRILANPPFVAAPPGEGTLYRDGGRLGEDVLARVVAGLPGHLAPAGDAYVITHLVRRDGEDEALAGQLDHGGFDVLVLDLAQYDARTMIFGQARPRLLGGGFDEYAAEVERWLRHAEEAGISRLSYSILAIRRAPAFRLERRALPPRSLGFSAASPAQIFERWAASEPPRVVS